MQLPERILGSTFLMERPLDSILHALDKALEVQEVDVDREQGPFILECRALRNHQVVVLDIRIYNQEGKYLVSMRRCGGDRQEAVYLANEIAAAAGLRGPVARPQNHYNPDLEDVKRYLVLLKGDSKSKMDGLCSAANARSVLETPQGRQLAERVAELCSSEEPHLRLAAISAAVCMVRAGCDRSLFACAVSEDDDPLFRIQANHLFSSKCK